MIKKISFDFAHIQIEAMKLGKSVHFTQVDLAKRFPFYPGLSTLEDLLIHSTKLVIPAGTVCTKTQNNISSLPYMNAWKKRVGGGEMQNTGKNLLYGYNVV